MSIAVCPPPADLERLFLGGLPEADARAIEQHVQACDVCAARLADLLAAKDTLSRSLSRDGRGDTFTSSPLVADLVKQLKSLRPNVSKGTAMITISCTGCQKKLSVKEELAGKKVKCPGCGKLTVVFVPAAVLQGEEMRTVPPTNNPDKGTIPPSQVDLRDNQTRPPLSKPDATLGVKPDDTSDASLTDFLAPPQSADELGRLSDYRILKILGHGGMGVVFLGEDVKLGRKVAIKAMLPHLAQSKSSQHRFLREAKAAAALEHDHIVPIFQVGEDRGAPFIVMPLLKGEPLDDRLKRDEAMPLADILRIGREVAKGLDAAHKSGLIHRDIKPANIWLEAPESRVKILDFGLARAATQEAGLTQAGAIIGTPAYMAPEQGRGDTVDARCDLFSLGVVLYRLCTGQQPFIGKDTVSTLMAVAMHDPTPPIKINREVPKELSDLVMKLLEKDLDKRIGSASEVVQALQNMEKKLAHAALAEEKTDAVATAVLPPARRAEPRKGPVTNQATPPRRKSAAMLAVAALAVFGFLGLIGAGGIVYYVQTNNGIVRIEINDPKIKVTFDKTNQTITGVDKKDIKLSVGEHGLHIQREDLEFDTDKFILKRGETITLKIEWFENGKLQVVQGDKVIGEKTRPKIDDGPPAGQQFALLFEEPIDGIEVPTLQIDKSSPLTLEGYFTQTKFVAGWQAPITTWNHFFIGNPGGERWEARIWEANILSGPPRVLGKKTHVAAVLDEHRHFLFIDGKLVASRALKAGDLDKGTTKLVLGNQYSGILDEVRISKVARYDKDFTPAKRFETDKDTVALYHLDEGTGDKLTDSSGNNHHGKIVGAKWVKVDGSAVGPASPTSVLEFTEQVTAIEVGVEGCKIPAGTDLTFEGIFTPGEVKNCPLIATEILSLELAHERFLFNAKPGNDLAPITLTTGSNFVKGARVHVAGVVTNKELRLYVDGKIVESRAVPKADWKLGAQVLKNLTFGYQGRLHGIHVSKTARYLKDFPPNHRLEADKDSLLLYHCDEGQGDVLKDSSGNSHHGKIVGAKWVKADAATVVSPEPPAAYALRFDGKASYVDVPSLRFPDLAEWCVEATAMREPGKSWATVASGGVFEHLFTVNESWGFGVIPDGNNFFGGGGPGRGVEHLAVVRKGNESKLYVNGKFIGKLDSTRGEKPSSFEHLRLGARPSAKGLERFFNGTIREVRVSKVARHNQEYTPAKRFETDKDTIALYHFEEGTGDVLKDSSGNNHHGKIVGAKWVKADAAALDLERGALEKMMTNGFSAGVFVDGKLVPKFVLADLSPDFEIRGFNCNRNKNASDENLACLDGLTHLVEVQITNCPVTDKALTHLRNSKGLRNLQLYASGVTDAGLPLLEGFTQLEYVDLKQTTVTEAGLKKLAAKLPKCTIAWNGGTIKPTVSALPPLDPAWLRAVAAMSAGKQVDAVVEKLKERNAGFKADKVKEYVKDDVVVSFDISDSKVTDISPVQAMTKLQGTFLCAGNDIDDLSPLKDLKLTYLNFNLTQVSDLTPLKDMKSLVHLSFFNAKVSDLTPLKDLNLTILKFPGNREIKDLSPLKDMKLTYLQYFGTSVTDLSPLKGVPLKQIYCDFVPERDEAVLRSMKTLQKIGETPVEEVWKNLDARRAAFEAWVKEAAGRAVTKQYDLVSAKLRERNLGFDGAWKEKIDDGVVRECDLVTDRVADLAPLRALTGLRVLRCAGSGPGKGVLANLAPLKDLKLTTLDCRNNKVTDLSVLKGMPLETLWCDFEPKRDAEILRSIPTLKTINGKDAKTFLKEAGVGPPSTSEEVWHQEVAAMPVAKQVAAVSQRMKEKNAGFDGKLKERIDAGVVTGLEFVTDQVTDLAPLRAFPNLTMLKCGGTHVAFKGKGKLEDLSPLKDMKLKTLHFPYTKVADLRPIKGLPLTDLNCHHTKVYDLTPLKNMKLKILDCAGTSTPAVDFAPLRDMPLIDVRGNFTVERDAEILRSIKSLETINGKPAKEFLK